MKTIDQQLVALEAENEKLRAGLERASSDFLLMRRHPRAGMSTVFTTAAIRRCWVAMGKWDEGPEGGAFDKVFDRMVVLFVGTKSEPRVISTEELWEQCRKEAIDWAFKTGVL